VTPGDLVQRGARALDRVRPMPSLVRARHGVAAEEARFGTP